MERGFRLFLILGALSALGPASMDIYLPGLPTLTREFGTTESTAQLTVSLYLVGLGVGQLIAGPMSDVRGRRSPLMAALAVYLVATVLCAVAPGIEVLVVSRLLQGATAAAGVVIGRAMVRDLFAGKAAARYLSRLVLIYGLAPMLAPLVGSQILRFTSWQGVFVVLGAAGGALLLVTAFALPETLPPERRQPASVRRTVTSLGDLLGHRRFLGYALALGFGTAGVAAYVSGSPFVVQDHFGKSPQVFGLLFALNATAMVVGSQLNAQLLGRYEPRRLLAGALAVMIAAAFALTLAAVKDLGLLPYAGSLVLFMATWGFVPANAIALASADHPDVAGSASALLGLAQYGIAAVAAPVVGVGGSSPTPMALVILVLAMLCTVSALAIARPARRPPISVLR
ncbi:multidrug effflux MFS transporter [Candidatus Solirubrobacter pratensis]|uniref:multidrug effflux MFS transporter n=1 Tax=Candidatus Solirubrobacter pratensis TaxID=1298857 RepID=UPI000404D247|nr:multidrug effflux MFS transporter [Candidatus Solirubrobacter pratensis]